MSISHVGPSLRDGLAFALLYTLLRIATGRLVDRRRRTTIISVGIATWSLMTALCGLAANFAQMFLARIGVGVGEATLSPAAYSTLSDWFEGKDLTRALSFYNSAIYIGAGLATIAGGALIALVPPIDTALTGPMEPWRVVFLLVGLPGLLVALLVLSLREPARRGHKVDTIPSIRDVIGYVWQRRAAYGWLIGGLSAASVMWNGMAAWAPTHFIRSFGWSVPEVGLRYGSALMLCGTAGIIFGGLVSGWFRDRGWADANIRVGIVSALAALPFGVVGPLMPNGWASLLVICGFLFAGAMPYGAAAAAFQEMTPNRMRGQVTAVYLFFINLFGIGLAPTIVAALTENVFGAEDQVRYSIATVVAATAPVSALLLHIACRHHDRAPAHG